MHPKDDGNWEYKQWANLLAGTPSSHDPPGTFSNGLSLQSTPEVYKISFKRATKTISSLNNGGDFSSENPKIFHSLNLNFDVAQLGFDNCSKGRCLVLGCSIKIYFEQFNCWT